jgi:CRP/FNR family transcriptional regulator, cyclic AMP receptor protein
MRTGGRGAWWTARVEWQLLSPLGPDDQAQVLAAARLRRFAKGEVVFHEGDPGESLHLVRSGRLLVRVSTAGGDTATLSVLSPGDAFGELALVADNHERTATIVALEAAETLSLRRSDFDALCSRHPGVAKLLVQVLGRRVDELSQLLLEALYVGVDRRVLRKLVQLADIYGPGGDSATIPITQDDLAGMAGATRPTVNQVLQGLAASGALVLGRGRIEVLDVTALRRRAGGPAAQGRHG